MRLRKSLASDVATLQLTHLMQIPCTQERNYNLRPCNYWPVSGARPNISGQLNHLLSSNGGKPQGVGALKWTGAEGPGCNLRDPNANGTFDPVIDASLKNSIYSGDRLQVPALQLLACIRC